MTDPINPSPDGFKYHCKICGMGFKGEYDRTKHRAETGHKSRKSVKEMQEAKAKRTGSAMQRILEYKGAIGEEIRNLEQERDEHQRAILKIDDTIREWTKFTSER